MLRAGRRNWFFIVVAGVLFVSPPADANAILSVFHGAVVIMGLALVPVVIVEAIVLTVQTGVSFGAALLGAAVANVASTLAGIPFANVALRWIALVGPKPVNRAAAAVLRYHVGDDTKTAGVAAETAGVLATFILFYVVSCGVEFVVLRNTLSFDAADNVFAATLWANTCSYGLIALFIGTLLAIAPLAPRHSRRKPDSAPPAARPGDHSMVADALVRARESRVINPGKDPKSRSA